MAGRVGKTYNGAQFRRILKLRMTIGLADDGCDLLIYLLYVNYINELVLSSDVQGKHAQLLKSLAG